MTMAGWYAILLDIQGAFLNGHFQGGEKLLMEVPQRFKKYYPGNVMLRLLRTIYGLKQLAMQFWREMAQAFKFMNYECNKADQCLYYAWSRGELIVWLT